MPCKIVAVNGSGGSGKDTFLDYVLTKLWAKGFTASKHSSVDNVKEAAYYLGWDGVKDHKGRQFLSDLKDISTREYDGPATYMINLVGELDNNFMFFHIREPEEISKFLENFYPISMAILVNREGIELFGNHADTNVKNHPYDFQIDNNGTLEELETQAELFVNYLIGETK